MAALLVSQAIGPGLVVTSSSSPSRLVVLQIRAPNELHEVAARLTDEIVLHLATRPTLRVLSQAELALVLAHEKDQLDLGGCSADPTTCFAGLGGAAEAERVLDTHLGRIGEMYWVTLTCWDTKRGAPDRGESAAADGIAELTTQTLDAVDRLFGDHQEASAAFRLSAPEAKKAAVLNLGSAQVSPELADNLTQLLALELRRAGGMSVISREEIKTMLDYEAQKQIILCTNDVSCLVEIGNALGVDYLVTGAVGKMDDIWMIHLKLIDVDAIEVVHRVSESYRGPERQLSQALRLAVAELLGRVPAGAGRLELLTDVEDGAVVIDGLA
ncbi:MAG: hypothetical protein HYZ27_10725, partial [Deltaproteobacteria bacterium]|nr:hypothetical protein [Deltaproteobacteria bacterium]